MDLSEIKYSESEFTTETVIEERIKITKKEILIVDDDPLVIKLLQAPLQKAGYQVKVADQGLKALDMVKKNPPDLILLDILMPMLDGFKVTRLLKFDKRYKDIPIIA